MINIKKKVKKLFPNLSEYYSLLKMERKDKRVIREITALNSAEYPRYLEKLYLEKTGHELNLKEPQRYTEKLQWRKLYDLEESYVQLSDKYKVRSWVEQKIGKEYLIPLLGVWESFDEIDFNELPESFVLKTNNASHTNIIVKNKKDFIKKKRVYKKKMDYWMSVPFGFLEGLELHYNKIHPVIIAEKFLKPIEGESDLVDYKFYCFGGKPFICQVIGDRSIGETVDFFDMSWEHVNIKRPPHGNAEKNITRPANFNNMVDIVGTLCKGFQHVRVDLYEHNDKIYFGEMTFTSASGLINFEPDEWDYKLGDLWNVNTLQVEKSVVYNE